MPINPVCITDPEALIVHADYRLELRFFGLLFEIYSNNQDLLDDLSTYYDSYRDIDQSEPASTIRLYAIEQPKLDSQLDWRDVPREAGKSDRKEAFFDISKQARWIRKTRTGMHMLQRRIAPIVVGPCRDNPAQVINFINNQFLNYYQNLGYTLGHASALEKGGRGIAIAASSGGGKSSLMLRLMEIDGTRFISNDRVMIQQIAGQAHLIGLAKLPRINPGTLLHSARLRHLLEKNYQEQLEKLPQGELWTLEDKYDVFIDQEYGEGRIALDTPLGSLIFLDWSLNSPDPTKLQSVDITQNPELIDGLMKRPAPFYQTAEGAFPPIDEPLDRTSYIQALSGVAIYQLAGRVDFDAAAKQIESEILS